MQSRLACRSEPFESDFTIDSQGVASGKILVLNLGAAPRLGLISQM
jgi:hypothetical protein